MGQLSNRRARAHRLACSIGSDDPNGLSEGMRVRRRDVLGFVGRSGISSATNFHLHFEVRPINVPVNPLPLLDIPADILIGPPQPSC